MRFESLEPRQVLAAANLVISELMANNGGSLLDGDGNASDWIEIRNAGATTVNLGDYFLTDSDTNLQKWAFPSINLNAGGYLVLFASAPLDANGNVLDNYVDGSGYRHTNFKLEAEGEYLGLTYEDPVTHATSVVYEYAEAFPEQRPNISYGISIGGLEQYWTTATPGATNSAGYEGVAAEPTFSVSRGFYDAPFQLTITSATPGTSIYYTMDGSSPAGSGTLYTGPITVSQTAPIRAIALKNNFVPSIVETHTYLFLNDIVRQTQASTVAAGYPANWSTRPADYGLDPDVIGTFDTNGNPLGGDLFGGVYANAIKDDLLAIPTISVVLNKNDMFASPNGIYYEPRNQGDLFERATSIEWITPDGAPQFQIDAGIQMHGGAFRSHALTRKHSFRLVFKDEYGPGELDFPLLGEGAIDEFNTLVLRATANDGYSWSSGQLTLQYSRDEFGRSLQRAMGNPSARNTMAHLYINGFYWGLYSPTERPDNNFAASYLGANADNWDGIHDDEANTGDFVAWNAMLAKTAQAGSSLTAYMELQGLNVNGTPHATAAPLLDVENYIDYLMVNVWGGNDDWPHHNFWAGRDRNPETTEGFQFFMWDYEGTMGNSRSWSPLNTLTFNQTFTGPNNVGQPHTNLKNNAEYKLLFADRVHKFFFNDGIFEPANLIARYTEIANRVEQVLIPESARWGDMHRPVPLTLTEWQTERDWILNTYLPQRSAIVMDEMRSYGFYPNTAAPSFNQHGGHVANGFDLSMVAPQGTIYYTLDGSDPRAIGGGIGSNAIPYTGSPIDIAAGAVVKARALNGSEWSALNEATFTVAAPASAGNFVITELNYTPHDPNPISGMGELNVDSQEFEFVELRNISGQDIDLTGVQFVEVPEGVDNEGIVFTFGSGTLAPGETILVVENQAAFESRYGLGHNIAGQYTGKLANGGEQITLRAANDSTILSFEYEDSDGWPTRSDGRGSSLEVIDVLGDFDSASNWRASSEFGGSPGASGSGSKYDIIINEVLAHSDGPTLDWIELYNSAGAALDLSRWYMSDDGDNLFKYQFGGGTSLAAGNYLTRNQTQLGFALDGQNGDELWLVEADPVTGVPLRFADVIEFDATATDVTLGRWLNGNGTAVMFPMTSPTMGSANSGPVAGDLVISEVHYNPASVPPAQQGSILQDELEFVELTNRSAGSCDIGNWSLTGITYTFPAGTTLAAGESIVVVRFNPSTAPTKAAAFRNVFGVLPSVRLFGAAGGQLNNAGEQVKLLRPEDPLNLATGEIMVDVFNYDEYAPWPTQADGGGSSLNRMNVNAFGNFVASWHAAAPAPGSFAAVNSGDFDGDGDVDGRDFLAWQRGFGKSNALPSDGDANFDAQVNAADLMVWADQYGEQTEVLAASVARENTLSAELVDASIAYTWTQKVEKDSATFFEEEQLYSAAAIEDALAELLPLAKSPTYEIDGDKSELQNDAAANEQPIFVAAEIAAQF